MPTIVHFEIPADDVERAKKFYSDLFGWKLEKWPGTDGNDDNKNYCLLNVANKIVHKCFVDSS